MSAPWFGPPGSPRPASDARTAEDQDTNALVRPYVVTAGRTGTGGTAVHVRSVVTASTAPSRAPVPDAVRRAEHALVLGVCARPHTAAQIALTLRIPFGVALVLVADLLRAGALDAVEPTASPAVDITLLERLRAGVAAL